MKKYKTERNIGILQDIVNGIQIKDIAIKHNLSRQRIKQIIDNITFNEFGKEHSSAYIENSESLRRKIKQFLQGVNYD